MFSPSMDGIQINWYYTKNYHFNFQLNSSLKKTKTLGMQCGQNRKLLKIVHCRLFLILCLFVAIPLAILEFILSTGRSMNSVGDSDGAETMKRTDNTHLLPHICDRCGKRFASGKALGGHRTVHGRNTRQRLSDDVGEVAADSIACPVCGIKFTSWKSVYGHMRTHRQRGWRGMQPPATTQVSSFPTSPSSTISEISSELRDKASIRVGNSTTDQVQVETTTELDEFESTQNTMRFRFQLSNKLEDDANRCSDEESLRNLRTRRLPKLEPKTVVASVPKSHVCSICGVSFPSHYALGGHVSFHNKKNSTSKSRKNKKTCDDKEDSMIRACRVKKLQCVEPTEPASGSVLKFDLNELPLIEDDEEGI